MAAVPDLPLLELFTRLQKAGLPLGIEDYEAVLQALQAGYGLPDRPALARLCRTLWVRSTDEQQLFDFYFEQLIGCEELPASSNEAHVLKAANSTKPAQNRELRNVIWKIIGVGAFGIAALIISDLRLPPHNPAKVFKPSTPIASTSPSPASPQASGTPTPVVSPSTAATPAPTPSTASSTTVLIIGALASVPILIILLAIQLDRILKRHQQSRPSLSKPSTPELRAKLASDLLRETGDEVQVAQTVRQVTSQGAGRSRDRFVLSADYLPVTQRQMKQSWRYLRRMVREGAATELNLEATVNRIARDGMLLEPVLVPQRVNRTELILLIDQEGSMVAFHSLSTRLVETAMRGGRLGNAGIYYFHNCPVGYLYHDPLHLEPEPVDEVLAGLWCDRTVVLIFSDAGAARGGRNQERVELTTAFLQQLQPQVRSVAWLNPMPKTRWAGTTAAELARVVPMFEGTRQGLDHAIDALRGKHASSLNKIELTLRTQP